MGFAATDVILLLFLWYVLDELHWVMSKTTEWRGQSSGVVDNFFISFASGFSNVAAFETL